MFAFASVFFPSWVTGPVEILLSQGWEGGKGSLFWGKQSFAWEKVPQTSLVQGNSKGKVLERLTWQLGIVTAAASRKQCLQYTHKYLPA